MAAVLTVLCRAAAHLKLGNAEAALKDAEAATELDPQYARAYLRQASAHQALEHFEEAVRDFEKVCMLHSAFRHVCLISVMKRMCLSVAYVHHNCNRRQHSCLGRLSTAKYQTPFM